MSDKSYKKFETAWCPGCGNFGIQEALKRALEKLDIEPWKVMITGGIGQAAKMPQYLNANGFCGLHGRALPAAAGAAIVNDELSVIISTGDGDSYGEGGNHFIHNVRRNANMAHFVHDNQIYGLTKGQASPTTASGHVTSVQALGTKTEPMNPLLIALSLGAGFVARAFSGEIDHLADIMAQAIEYDGYALVDILQPCVSFNKVNTFKWYKDRVYKLDEEYDTKSLASAIEKAEEWGESIPIGVIYKNEDKVSFNKKYEFLNNGSSLVDFEPDINKVEAYMEDMK